MPAKAVEECPEGNDLRPPSTDESLLADQGINGNLDMQTGRMNYPAHAFSCLSHLHRERKSGRNLPGYRLSRGHGRWYSENTDRLDSSRIPSRAEQGRYGMDMKSDSNGGSWTHLPASADSHEWWRCMADRLANPMAVTIASGINNEMNRFVPEGILIS